MKLGPWEWLSAPVSELLGPKGGQAWWRYMESDALARDRPLVLKSS
jgi:hypothetical protein